jgi:tRNA-2-methylthio-N6-dimethylallyladenosine synthase
MKFWIETWGCQMNQLDSARLSGRFLQAGFSAAETLDEADLFLLNTCSVRQKAEEKVYARLGELKAWKKSREGRRIGLCGCIAQQHKARLFERSPLLDFVFGPGEVEHAAALIQSGAATAFTLSKTLEYDAASVDRSNEITPMLTVAEGCNLFCSFCIVPFVRGRQRSRPSAAIETEVRDLLAKGFDDLMLLGQVVNAYRDPETGLGLTGLLARLSAIPGLRNLAFVTSHPAHFDFDLIPLLRDNPVLSRYFHMPAQCGSDRILKAMNRPYTNDAYRGMMLALKDAVPDIALSSDFIVGFPGETEADFEDTLTLIREIRFASLYAFAYSPRPGTKAARLEDDVPRAEKMRRLRALLDLQNGIQREENRRLEGRVMPVHVIEKPENKALWIGRTKCNRVVNFSASEGSDVARGRWVDVEITEGLPHSLRGKLFP